MDRSDKTLTLAVGLPAFNEEANIKSLLSDILSQKQDGFVLERILIYSDGSTDNTEREVLSLNDPRINFIASSERKGIAHGLNVIFSTATEDCLLLLNADIRIFDNDALAKMVEPIIQGKADFASGNLMELPPRTFAERALYASCDFKRLLFRSWKNGRNLFTCSGPIRAFSKKVYSQLRFPYSIGDDMYSYLYAVSRKFRYDWVENAAAFYRLPDNFKDYLKQSTWFSHAAMTISKDFPEIFPAEFNIPKKLIITPLIKTWIRHPITFSAYIFMVVSSRISAMLTGSDKNRELWAVADSSKKL